MRGIESLEVISLRTSAALRVDVSFSMVQGPAIKARGFSLQYAPYRQIPSWSRYFPRIPLTYDTWPLTTLFNGRLYEIPE